MTELLHQTMSRRRPIICIRAWMKTWPLVFFAVCFCLTLLPGSGSAEIIPAGRVIGVTGDVDHRFGPEGLRVATAGTPVILNQHFRTEADSRATLRLRDGSRILMGPVSLLTIDDFVYAPTEGLAGKAFTLYRGSFQYFSGLEAYTSQLSILTPVTTIVTEGGSLAGFHIPGAGTIVTVIDGEATLKTRFDDISMAKGETAVIGPDGRGGLTPAHVPHPLALETLRFIKKQIGFYKVRTPTARKLAEEGRYNALSELNQRYEISETSDISPQDWPSEKSQAGLFRLAQTQMPLLFEAQQRGLLDQHFKINDNKENFSARAEKRNPTAEKALETLTSNLDVINTEIKKGALSEVSAGLDSQNLSAANVATFVASTAAAAPERALEISAAGLEIMDNPTARQAEMIAEQAVRAAPEKANDLAAQAIASLPEGQQLEKAREIVRTMMAHAPKRSTAAREEAGTRTSSALEQLSPEVQQAIADELKNEGFQEGGATPGSGASDTPSAQTGLATPETPQVGSTGGAVDVVTFFNTFNYIIAFVVLILIGILSYMLYRMNTEQQKMLRAKRRRELQVARRHRERVAALEQQYEELIQSGQPHDQDIDAHKPKE